MLSLYRYVIPFFVLLLTVISAGCAGNPDADTVLLVNESPVLPVAGGEVSYNFTISDGLTGQPVPSMWVVVTPLDGANKDNPVVWSSNKYGVCRAVSYSGESVTWTVAHGSERYREQSGNLTVKPGMRDIPIILLPRTAATFGV